jgi:zinc protease
LINDIRIAIEKRCGMHFNAWMKKHVYAILILLIFIVFIDPCLAKSSKTPKHPSKIKYEKLGWEVPLGSPYRMDLSNGLRLYIAEDKSLPLVTIRGYFKSGTINDPAVKEGLGSFTAHLMRTGGTKDIPSDTLDALIEHFAMSISLSMSKTKLSFRAKFLSQFTDTALYIIEQVLFHPAFEQKKIDKERDIAIQNILHRFDNPEPLIGAAYIKTMYPKGNNSKLSTEKSMKALTRDDLLALHKSTIKTENLLLAVSGNFNKKDIVKKLEKIFPTVSKDYKAPDFPQIEIMPPVKFLIVHKEISQAYIRIGLPFFKRPHPDYYAMSVFNNILGGGGFTSRLTSTIRSDEGLTYSIHSYAGTNYVYPATFLISFFTKHATTNKAIALTLKEVDKILKDGITKKELENTKKVFIEGLPSSFRSKDDIVDTYAWNEYYNRSEDHYNVYPDKIRALKLKDVNTAAAKHIDPAKFTFVIVADTTELFKAEKSDGFSVREQTDIKIIIPDMLYNPLLFKEK